MRKTATLFFSGLAFMVIAAFGCNVTDVVTRSATLTGAKENPANASTATGTFSITFDGPQAVYTLNVTNLAGITASHIHEGLAAANGSVTVYLYDGRPSGCGTAASPGCPLAAAYTGPLGVGSFTAEMVTACTPGCLAGRSFAGIQAAASANPSNAYVNVHTTAFGGGEIRGQIQ